MAQLPCIGLSWPLTNPPFGGCAIYFHYGVYDFDFTYVLFLHDMFLSTEFRRISREYHLVAKKDKTKQFLGLSRKIDM